MPEKLNKGSARRPKGLLGNGGSGPVVTLSITLPPWQRVWWPWEPKPPAPKRGRGAPRREEITKIHKTGETTKSGGEWVIVKRGAVYSAPFRSRRSKRLIISGSERASGQGSGSANNFQPGPEPGFYEVVNGRYYGGLPSMQQTFPPKTTIQSAPASQWAPSQGYSVLRPGL